jgi:hypothetical protein
MTMVCPLLLAQMAPPDPLALPMLALRRWFESTSLSASQAEPTARALLAWLCGMAILLVLVLVLQGPRRALGQLLDLRFHLRLLRTALLRLKRAGRTVTVLLGSTVIAWTGFQFAHYSEQPRLDDLMVFQRGRSLSELAFEQATFAALVPLRDLASLGDQILLLIAAGILVFKLAADRWGGNDDPYEEMANPLPAWTTPCWGATWLYALYRLAGVIMGMEGYPAGGCFVVEALGVPVLMALADGLLLGWVLVELRRAGYADDITALDVRSTVALWPMAGLTCLLIMPGRYLAVATWLAMPYAPGGLSQRWLAPGLLGGRLMLALQVAALAMVPLAGALAWGGRSLRGLFRGYVGILREHGGHAVAALLLSGLTVGVPVGLVYLAVLTLPRQPWLLAAADSYAHYASLVAGLVLLAALVELGARSLPRASTVAVAPAQPALEALTTDPNEAVSD